MQGNISRLLIIRSDRTLHNEGKEGSLSDKCAAEHGYIEVAHIAFKVFSEIYSTFKVSATPFVMRAYNTLRTVANRESILHKRISDDWLQFHH